MINGAERKINNTMNHSIEEILAAHERLNNNVHPIVKENGDFICFIRQDSFVLFLALTGKLPGSFIERESSCPNETNANEIECELSDYINKHLKGVDQDALVEKMLKIRDRLLTQKQRDYVIKMRQKYPKSLFKDR